MGAGRGTIGVSGEVFDAALVSGLLILSSMFLEADNPVDSDIEADTGRGGEGSSNVVPSA